MTGQAAANWYPDPIGRHEFRYWDGTQWTQHVSSLGRQGVDPPVGGSPVPAASRTGRRIQRDVRRAGVEAGARSGGGTLFSEPVLVVNQKAKLVEVNAEYAVYDQHGRQVGAVREVGRSVMKNLVSVVPDANRTHRLQVVDVNGQILMTLTRPAKMIRSRVKVRDAHGAEIGQIAQKNLGLLGSVRFVLESGGQSVGSLNGEDWDLWDFNIQDVAGNEVARITKTWSGMAKEIFTRGDKYVLQIQHPLDEPLRSLVIAAALAVDTALRQGGN